MQVHNLILRSFELASHKSCQKPCTLNSGLSVRLEPGACVLLMISCCVLDWHGAILSMYDFVLTHSRPNCPMLILIFS